MKIVLSQPLYNEKNSYSGNSRNNSSDKLLWNSFKEGSRKSFQYIYDQNFEQLLRYGLKFSSNQSMVEDQIQELFIYLWQKKENLEIHGSITGYLLWSLRNRIVKQQKATKTYSIENEYALLERSDDSLDEDKFDNLLESLECLPPKQREVIHLKYFQNMDGEEIAKIMNITIGATYNLISRAVINLKSKISTSIILLALFL